MTRKRLRTYRRSTRRGFTLTEMIVSLAIVVFAMAIVANVFSLTTRTTQATAALRETRQAMRDLFTELRADLQGVDPARSVLVLSGWTQAAALTEDNIAARRYFRVLQGDPTAVPPAYNPETATAAANGYSNPRTDVMMFFTNRPGVSKAPPVIAPTQVNQDWARFQRELYDGVARSPQLVVYGHAALARPGALGSPQHLPLGNQGQVISPIPVSRWQLARRAAILRRIDAGNASQIFRLADTTLPNGARQVLNTQMDRLIGYQTDAFGGSSASRDLAGDALELDYLRWLDFMDSGNSAANRWALKDPYSFDTWGQQRDRDWIFRLIYHPTSPTASRHIATIIENPPPEAFPNQALRALAGCAWFQIEFLMPEDPRNSRQHGDSRQWSSPERWVSIEHDRTYVFVPDSPSNRALLSSAHSTPSALNWTVEEVRIPLAPQLSPPDARSEFSPANAEEVNQGLPIYIIRTWPYAVRITVRAIDPEGRLPEPLVRSMVHRFD